VSGSVKEESGDLNSEELVSYCQKAKGKGQLKQKKAVRNSEETVGYGNREELRDTEKVGESETKTSKSRNDQRKIQNFRSEKS